MKKIEFLAIVLFVSIMLTTAFSGFARAETATIWTDKPDYTPGETVTIFGSGFNTFANVTVTIERPDGTIDAVYAVTSDVGNFTCTYQLDGITGTYTATATDGTNTATTTFTDRTWSVSVSPASATVPQGTSTTATVTVTASPEGGPKMDLSATGQPTDVTVSFSPASEIPNFDSTMNVSVGPTAPLGDHVITIHVRVGEGVGIGEEKATTNFTLTVTAAADLSITKSGPQCAHVGDEITYEFTVKNDGPGPAANVNVTDPLLGGLIYGPKDLATGASDTFTVTYTVKTTDTDPLTNEATVASDTPDPNSTNNVASWSVDILHPAIEVTKTADKTMAHVGDTITYNITVSNPSTDTTMYKVSVIDSLLGDISAAFSASLSPGASETKTFTYTVPSPQILDVENTVTVTYKDILGLEKTDDASWTVDILHPSIDVAKSGPLYAHEGDTITYTITVNNTGDCPLYSVSVTDTLLGTIYSNGLAFGETKTFTKTYTVPSPSTVISNTVTASGSDILGRQVSDTASWTVTVLHPAIDVTKTGPTYAHPGDTITYTITVNNTGDCPLFSVSATDTLLGNLTGYLPDTTLDVGEVDTFTVNYFVPTTTPSGDIKNTVTAVGYDALNLKVSDTASWTVHIVPRSLVTDSRLCYFDVDSSIGGQQFRLIFTQDSANAFTLRASNPGQFYYNVFYIGTPGDTITLDISIPYPFVTQGSEPIHVYSLVTISGGCFVPSGELTGFTITGTSTTTPSGALGINLTDYNPQTFGQNVTITIVGQVPSSTLVYVTIHLDYGLKGTSSYGKNINNDAIDPTTSMIKIPNLGSYIFSVGGAMSDSQAIQNENVFKRDPGIAGLVLDIAGTPLQGVKVEIYNSNGKLLATLYTDQDGWYQWFHKYTGKPTTFTVKLPKYNLQTTVIFKANGFIEIDFQLPDTITVYSKYN